MSLSISIHCILISLDSAFDYCGKSGKYVVTVTFNNTKFYVLVNLSKSDEIENFVIGGQQENYPAKMCVDLLHCLLAARTFTESGKVDALLDWEEDKSFII